MPSFEEARGTILESIPLLGAERVDLLSARGRVAAEDMTAPWDMPFFDNSAMDGFAVRAEDCRQGATLRVTGYVPAGEYGGNEVTPGCAVRIMTGAAIPSGCDTVIPIEDVEERADGILLREKVVPRQHVRLRGEDIREGERILSDGTILRTPEISMLASFGKAYPSVRRRARVAVLSTGDELIDVGEPPERGKIINSNAFSLAAALQEIGAEAVILGIARDNRENLMEKLAEGLNADALITTAGVSVGDRDLVRGCLAELGVRQLFWKVDIKPGGPFAFGMKEGIPVFSLPGNPVSSMITFEMLVRPALLRMMGRRRVIRPLVNAMLRGEAHKKPGKVHFFRVRVETEGGRFWAASAGDQNTGILSTMVRANGIAVLAEERTGFAAGEEVPVHLLYEDLEMKEE